MSLKQTNLQKSFFDTSHVCNNLLNNDNFFYIFREEIFPMLTDEAFKDMYSDLGRNAIPPTLLSYTSLFQYIENTPDRQAAYNVVMRIDWKYALNLPVDYAGFHFSNLSNFRERLLENEKERILFEKILDKLIEKGYIKNRGKQRIDSTRVIGHLRDLSIYECLSETIRITLNYLSENHPEVYSKIEEKVQKKYSTKLSDFKFTPEEKKEKFLEIGEEFLQIKRTIEGSKIDNNENEIKLFIDIFNENFEVSNKKVSGTIRKVKDKIRNPHEPEAKLSKKGSKRWVGYKAQIIETAEKKTQNFITNIELTDSTKNDNTALEEWIEEEKKISPEKLYADSGYVNGDTIQKLAERDIALTGPIQNESSPKGKFKQKDFKIDIKKEKAVCPANKKSCFVNQAKDRRGRKLITLNFGNQCQTCKLKNKCTTNPNGRILTISYNYKIIQKRRKLQKTKKFKKEMHNRNAIEGTISELIRKHGMRKGRYFGKTKTKLQLLFTGAAVNVKRWIKVCREEIFNSGLCPANG